MPLHGLNVAQAVRAGHRRSADPAGHRSAAPAGHRNRAGRAVHHRVTSADPADPADRAVRPRATSADPADPAVPAAPGDFRGPGGGPGGPPPGDFRGPDNHDWRPPWNPGDNDWRGRFHGAPWGDGSAAVGLGRAAAAAVGWTVAGGVGTASAANQLLRLQRATGVGSRLQPVGLLVLRDLDSAPDLTCIRRDGRLGMPGAVVRTQFTCSE